jgi:hypothetical protein
MENFTSEIYGFLESCGLCIYKVRSECGFESISVCTSPEGKSHSIILLGIVADSLEKARSQQAAVSEEITTLRSENGHYPLIVTEDRWRRQNEAMHLRILSHLEIFTQIYARNCEIRRIDKATAQAFLEANHSYGDASCKYRYGLYLKRHTGHNAVIADSVRQSLLPGTLVAVATFSNARKWAKGDKTIRSYEWTRYASLPGVRLSGGMGRLLKAFIKDVKPDDIMTYADLEWSEGKVYEQLGFTLEGTRPSVTFTIDTSEWSRTAMSSEATVGVDMPPPARRFFQNFGSNKYRLKLTDYQ